MLASVFLPILLAFCRVTRCAEPPATEREIVLQNLFPVAQTDVKSCPWVHISPDLWLYVASKIEDDETLWNLGLTCKTLGALLRQPLGFQLFFQNMPYPKLLNFLVENNQMIGEWAAPLLTDENVLQTDMFKTNPCLYADCGDRHLSTLGTQMIVNMFLPRAQNLNVEKMIYFDIANRRHISIESIPDQLEGNLFYALNEATNHDEIHYLPECKDSKLFDHINPSTLARLTWSFDGSWKMFIDSILADYVIPAWRNEYTLTAHETTCIQALVRWSPMYTEYFNSLMWALFYINGALGTDYQAIDQIGVFLELLGFPFLSMKSAWTTSSLRFEWRERNQCMLYIYAVAVQWKLDLKLLALATPLNPISKSILEGTVPDYVLELAELNENNIFRIAQEGETSLLQKAIFIDGKFVKQDSPASLKRMRAEEDGVEIESNKRPKFYHGSRPVIQDPSTFFTAALSPSEVPDFLRSIGAVFSNVGYSDMGEGSSENGESSDENSDEEGSDDNDAFSSSNQSESSEDNQ